MKLRFKNHLAKHFPDWNIKKNRYKCLSIFFCIFSQQAVPVWCVPASRLRELHLELFQVIRFFFINNKITEDIQWNVPTQQFHYKYFYSIELHLIFTVQHFARYALYRKTFYCKRVTIHLTIWTVFFFLNITMHSFSAAGIAASSALAGCNTAFGTCEAKCVAALVSFSL